MEFKNTIWRIVFAFSLVVSNASAQGVDSLSQFPAWQPGLLDIHHINTTKGNATFIICPDGTTILIDAGDMDVKRFNKKYYPMTANSERLGDTAFAAGKYIVEYIKKVLPVSHPAAIDYAVVTHYHQDHYGNVRPNTPVAANGAYRLTGITEVGTLLPLFTLIDRGHSFPVPLDSYYTDPTFQNYLAFTRYQQEHNGLSVQTLAAGSNSQLRLLHDSASYPSFYVRNIKCNTLVWTGENNDARIIIPERELLDEKNKFQENPLSLALRISYGSFDYYTGGDNTGIPNPAVNKPDVETPMADVIGKTDVMTLDHHGNRDGNNAHFLQQLSPQVVIGQTWCSDHPGQELAFRLLQHKDGVTKPDVFLTHLHNEAGAYLGPWITNGFKNTNGHTLVRVLPGGQFYVLILHEDTNKMDIEKQFGPYSAN